MRGFTVPLSAGDDSFKARKRQLVLDAMFRAKIPYRLISGQQTAGGSRRLR